MSKISLLLQRVHARVHDLPMKSHFSEPKISIGNLDFSQWHTLSKTEKKLPLSKIWFILTVFIPLKQKKNNSKQVLTAV